MGNYFAIGSTAPQRAGPAADKLFRTAKNGFAARISGKDADAPADNDDGSEEGTGGVEDRIHHFLVAYPKAHEGDVEDFTFSGQLKDMASYMRDLRHISVEREASAEYVIFSLYELALTTEIRLLDCCKISRA